MYALLAVPILQAAGIVQVLAAGFLDVTLWALTAFFGLGMLMDLASRSVPERPKARSGR